MWALAQLPGLPEGVYLALNVSPRTLVSDAFAGILDDVALDRIVLEVTEHDAVADYEALLATIRPLAEAGVRLAIDDAGTGFSGLHQILRLSPHIIKFDAALIRDVDSCPAKQAMIAALLTFTRRMHIAPLAEAIETTAELDTLRALGVTYGQGYHLARPQALPHHDATALPQVQAADTDRTHAAASRP